MLLIIVSQLATYLLNSTLVCNDMYLEVIHSKFVKNLISYFTGCVHKGTNHVPKDVSDRDPLRDWDRDFNYVHSHALQTPSQSQTGSAHCEVIFCSYCAVRADSCMASARISKMHTHESRSERALRSHVQESGFLRWSRSKTPFFFAFQKPDLKELCVHKG